MNNLNEKSLIRRLAWTALLLTGIAMLSMVGIGYLLYQANESTVASVPPPAVTASPTIAEAPAAPVEPQIINGKDVETSLLVGEGWQTVKATCTACHSSQLILQNRFSREGWHQKIVWMQETQGLWDLGESEPIILDYLAAYYAPGEAIGRRRPLENIEWYELRD